MKKLLIIDEENSHSKFLKWILNEEACKILTATSFREALNLLRENLVHLILLDLIMTNIDGFEILDYLKSDEKLREIPVIVVSTKNDRESIEASMRKGALDYIVKPYNPEVLRNKIAITLKIDLTTNMETN